MNHLGSLEIEFISQVNSLTDRAYLVNSSDVLFLFENGEYQIFNISTRNLIISGNIPTKFDCSETIVFPGHLLLYEDVETKHYRFFHLLEQKILPDISVSLAGTEEFQNTFSKTDIERRVAVVYEKGLGDKMQATAVQLNQSFRKTFKVSPFTMNDGSLYVLNENLVLLYDNDFSKELKFFAWDLINNEIQKVRIGVEDEIGTIENVFHYGNNNIVVFGHYNKQSPAFVRIFQLPDDIKDELIPSKEILLSFTDTLTNIIKEVFYVNPTNANCLYLSTNTEGLNFLIVDLLSKRVNFMLEQDDDEPPIFSSLNDMVLRYDFQYNPAENGDILNVTLIRSLNLAHTLIHLYSRKGILQKYSESVLKKAIEYQFISLNRSIDEKIKV